MNSFKIDRKPPFFEGWYFKQQTESDTIAFIVGRNVAENGTGSAFIQVLTETKSYNINFPLKDFRRTKKGFGIIIGKNWFTDKGLYVDIDSGGIIVKGKVRYGSFTTLKHPIMGPFDKAPMECHHDIVSLYHSVDGWLIANGKAIEFDDAVGYIEGDSGMSFPKSYLWLQCNDFRYIGCQCSEHASRLVHRIVPKEITSKRFVMPPKACVFFSMAEIPVVRMFFKGMICIVFYKEKQYRFATYLGAKVEFCNDSCIIIRQGKYKLVIKLTCAKGQTLLAPQNGNMVRAIEESLVGKGKFWFYENNQLLFALESDRCSYEKVE